MKPRQTIDLLDRLPSPEAVRARLKSTQRDARCLELLLSTVVDD